MQSQLFKHAFLSLVLVALLDLVALKLRLFWTYSWFDMVVHFIGGFCVALASVWFASLYLKSAMSYRKIIFSSLFGAVIIGLLWEWFELYFGITFLSDGMIYVADTASDLSMDLLGGLFGSLYAFNILKNQK